MTDLQRADAAASPESSTDSKGGVGKNIVASFKNRSKRIKTVADSTSAVPQSGQPTVTPETPKEHAGPMTQLQMPPVAMPPLDMPPPTVPPTDMIPPTLGAPAHPVNAQVGTGPSVAVQLAPTPAKPSVKTVRPHTGHQTRRARLRISRVDPWSVMKTALLFAVAAWVIFIVATWVVFTVLDMTGLYDAINSTVAQIFASPGQTSTFNIKDYINTTRATALAALVGAVNVVIGTALATIFAFLYNLSAVVMGGIEVTMAED
ncbi:MAG: DUF3566 domain-containing protein [Propionibacteriaceae bacterium]|nr:DUF3566 domain-containing protein [Propionibacteriaceae bacterium]